MRKKFEEHLAHNFPFIKNKKLLLAISGGIDSVVMFHLFQNTASQISIAHCNFQLRGKESDDDQKFVEELAARHHVRCHVVVFKTEAIAKQIGMSIQMTARELRYHWFTELVEIEHYDYIATAHQADDNVETFFINLLRGTGLDGLVGIPPINDKVIRPLLPFGREEIEAYAKSMKLTWREDSSNASSKYVRNQIRHDILPILKSIRPDFLQSFHKTQSFLQETKEMVEDASAIVYEEAAQEVDDCLEIDLNNLMRLPNYKSYLFHWLKDYGFTDWLAIHELVSGQSGKVIYGDSCRLIKDRAKLILCPNDTDEFAIYHIEKGQQEVKIPLNMTFCKVNDISPVSNSSIFVDEDKLKFPLQIRKWIEGESFQPFGMNGDSKKVSKLLKDIKLSLFEKEAVWLLCSDNQIVWVVGIRADERFKVQDSTKNIVNISVHQ